MDILRLTVIAAHVSSKETREAWAPPPTGNGESMTLLEYAGKVGPKEKIIEQNGKKYVVRESPHRQKKPININFK